MNKTMPENDLALAHANEGIRLGAEGNIEQSLEEWEAASRIADIHLQASDLYYWIKSGFGSALFDVKKYEQSIAVSSLAREWCLKLSQLLPSLTIAKSYLALAQNDEARPYLKEVHALIGDAIFEQFEKEDEGVVRTAISGI